MLKASTTTLLNLSNLRYIQKVLGPIIWALLFYSQAYALENDKSALTKLADDSQWLNLYRYHKVGLDNDSTVVNDSWFFHPEGRHNPYLELEAAIEILSKDENKRCLFPARTLFLKHKGLLQTQKDTCPKYEYFAKKLKLKNVWIVFASYYVNNPSSAFGHTLFKIQGEGHEENDYLEYGANFAAQATTANPLAYAVLGLTGGFLGNYGLLPYFVKIQEYNDSETRDLWEYKLNLNDFEKKLFLAHLWEMDQAQYKYYYLTENCSYHLLWFLDAIRPSLKFREKMPYFVLPSETLSILNSEKDFVSQIKKRPSQFNVVQARYNLLTDQAKDYWNDEKKFIPQDQFTSEEKADYLDFGIDYLDLNYRNELNQEVKTKGGKFTSLKREIQGERSKLNLDTKHLPVETNNSPEQIHPPRIIALGYDWRQYEALGSQKKSIHQNMLLRYRFAFHELLDDPKGAPTWSELIMGKITARYDETDKKAYLDQFTLFKTHANQQTILSPFALTWLVEMGARDHLFSANHDFGPYVKSHIGYNWQNNNHLLRFIIPFEVDYSSSNSFIKSNWKLVTQPSLSYYLLLSKKMRINLDLGLIWRSYLKEYWKEFASTSMQIDLFKNVSLEVNSHLQKEHYQAQTLLKYYF